MYACFIQTSSFISVAQQAGGGQDFWPGNFWWPTGKKEWRKKWKRGKMEKKRRKIVKGRWKIENGRRESMKMSRGFFFFFCFSLLKMMKICFGATKMEICYWEKAFHTGKNIWKNDFAPSEKCFCYAPALFASKVITSSYSSNWIMLLLLPIRAPLIMCCDWFDRGSRQVKHDLVDLVTEDLYDDIILRWQIYIISLGLMVSLLDLHLK